MLATPHLMLFCDRDYHAHQEENRLSFASTISNRFHHAWNPARQAPTSHATPARLVNGDEVIMNSSTWPVGTHHSATASQPPQGRLSTGLSSSGPASPAHARVVAATVPPSSNHPSPDFSHGVGNLAPKSSLFFSSPQSTPGAASRRGSYILSLRASTWTADSHGLFDYESRNVHGKIFKCTCAHDSYSIVRIGTDIHLINDDEAKSIADPRAKFLAHLVQTNGGFGIAPGIDLRSGVASTEKLWLVVRTLKERGVALRQGDTIKLGRYRLKVKEVAASSHDEKNTNTRRFFTTEDDDDDCETVAPDGALDNSLVLDQPEVAGLDIASASGAPAIAAQLRFSPFQTVGVPSASIGRPNFVTSGSINQLNSTSADLGIPAASLERTTTLQQLADVEDVLGSRSCSVELQSQPDGSAQEDVSPLKKVESMRKLYQSKGSTDNIRICRICLCGSDDSDFDDRLNPMVAPCECKGSMKWVHLLCLRTWMAGRLNIRNDGNMVCFFWRSLECELCKVQYPPVVQVADYTSSSEGGKAPPVGVLAGTEKGRIRQAFDQTELGSSVSSSGSSLVGCRKTTSGWRVVDLFEIPRPQIPYAILEPRHQQGKGLHVLSLANDKIARLGRGHESDIRLADISVSRLHAIIKFRKFAGAGPSHKKMTTVFGGGSAPSSSARTGGVASSAGGGSNSVGVASSAQSPPNTGDEEVLANAIVAGSTGFVHPAINGCFVIEDNRSKFGTLLEIQKAFKLDFALGVPISVQVGRTVLTFAFKKRWRLRIPACFRQQSSDVSVVLQQLPPQGMAANLIVTPLLAHSAAEVDGESGGEQHSSRSAAAAGGSHPESLPEGGISTVGPENPPSAAS